MMSFGTMKDKGTFRNVCRAYNKKAEDYNTVSKNIEAYREHSEWKEIIEVSEQMENIIESSSPNPCGFLLLDKDIREEIGVIRIGTKKNGEPCFCAMIDKTTADKWKYLKND